MKNKILIILIAILQVFFTKTVFSQDVEFNASTIEILNEKELTIANDAEAVIKADGIRVEGSVIKYFKGKSLLTVENGKISKIDNNLEINANKIRYEINNSRLTLNNRIKIEDNQNNIVINSDEIGLSRSRNLAIKTATSDLCLFSDDDIIYLKTIIFRDFFKWGERVQ